MLPARVTAATKKMFRDPLSLLRDVKPLVTALGGIFAILLTVVLGLSSPGAQDPGREVGSSDDYIAPMPDDQAHLEEIRTDMGYAIKELRAREFEETGVLVPPMVIDPTLQIQADRWAQSNAVENSESAIERNIAMLQVHLPAEEATAEKLVGLILQSQPHTDLLLDPGMSFYGIGMAQGHGQVWAVIMMSASDADLDALTAPAAPQNSGSSGGDN